MHDWRAYVRGHLPALKTGPARESDIVAELALQLEQAYSEAIAAGVPEQDAIERAKVPFRDWEGLARDINAAEPEPVRHARLWSGTGQDLRYAARFLRHNPMFAAIAVATLAFGIGGNTAIFSMVDALALRSLPYLDPSRIVAIETRKAQQPEVDPWTSALDFFDLRERAHSFTSVAAISPVWDVVLTGRGDTEKLSCLYVSQSFFPLIGLQPILGRAFLPEEDNRAKPGTVVVLSYSLWQRKFGGSREIIGQPLAIDGGTYNVIGVLPPRFRYAGEPLAGTATDIDVWLPLSANQLIGSIRGLRFLKVIGRLASDVPLQHAREEVRSIGIALAEQYPESDRGFAVDARPLNEQVTGPVRVTMWLLLGTVGFVLLMACANVANLLLARAAARQREISVRIALGASRFRLLRQLLVESLVLAVSGGVLGLAVAWAGLKLLIAAAPQSLVHARDIGLDGRTLLFTTVAVMTAAVLAGLPSAWRARRLDVEAALRAAGRGMAGGNHRLRASLVVAQVAVALLLLVGSGLLIRSFQRLLDVNPGFNPHNLLTISTQMPNSASTPAKRAAVLSVMRESLMAVPGVHSVAAVSRLPMAGRNLGSWLFIEGRTMPGQQGYDVEYRVATPNYFSTMGIPLRDGRLFDEHDGAVASSVVLINETIAHKFWPGESAVGKRIKLGASPERQPWITVIGVVADLRHGGLDVDPRPEIYRPYAVNPLGAPILVIRTDGDPSPLVSTLAATVRSVGEGVPAYNVYRMETLVERSTAERRFVMWLLTAFAVAALLLAGVGIYGTVSQAVVQRTQEIGLRMALGASPGAALGLVFGQGIRLTALGIVIGCGAALGLTRLMRKLLFEVRPLDPAAFLGAVVVLAGFAALACYVPARRATRVDPLAALRQE